MDIATLIAIAIAVVIVGSIGWRSWRVRRLYKQGAPHVAEVLESSQTGTTVNNVPLEKTVRQLNSR